VNVAINAISVALLLFGCTVTALTPNGSQVRAMTEFDKPQCTYVTEVTASGRCSGWNTCSKEFLEDDIISVAFNKIAAEGGNAYGLVDNYGLQRFAMEAWLCGWEQHPISSHAESEAPPNKISAEDRTKCRYLKTFAAGSNQIGYGRRYWDAQEEALARVQKIGGDSYFLAKVLQSTGAPVLLVEAWRCEFDESKH